MTDKENEFRELDDVFRAAAAGTPQPDQALLARVLADAQRVQDGFATASPAARAQHPGPWHEFLSALGGWRAMAGLATAAAAGVWLGAFPPGFLPDATGVYLGVSDAGYLIDTAPGLGFDLAEEAL